MSKLVADVRDGSCEELDDYLSTATGAIFADEGPLDLTLRQAQRWRVLYSAVQALHDDGLVAVLPQRPPPGSQRCPSRSGGGYRSSRCRMHWPNRLLWFVFMVPSTRRLLLEWEHEAALSVAALRAEAGRDLSEPDYQELITELLDGSPDFAAIWARQHVRGRQVGLKRFQHPELGHLDLEFTSFQVAEQPSLRLSLYTPADDGRSETKLREAVAPRPGPSSGA
jgi:hypothetical protein